MRHFTWKGVAAIGAIAVLIVGGLAFAVSAEPPSPEEEEPTVEVTDSSSDSAVCNLTIRVCAKVEGQVVPMGNVPYEIYSVSVNRTEEKIVIELTLMAEGVTDSEGVAKVELEKGKYVIVATYYGLKGFGKVNLTEDMCQKIQLHNWNKSMCQVRNDCPKISIVSDC